MSKFLLTSTSIRQSWRWLVLLLLVAGLFVARNSIAEDEADTLTAVAQATPAKTGKVDGPILGKVDPKTSRVTGYKKPSEGELKRRLTSLQYNVTQNESTEPSFQNRYWDNKKDGIYECIVCGQDLFSSTTKYKSGTGWPSFYAPLPGGKVGSKTDYFLFYPRTEVHCSRCNAHLGHVFEDGPEPTGKRYCMNSASMNFVEKKESKDVK
ncbi:MAG: peptide-methionine (R)-S-oxide reductase MsrB [Planctomycetota bacterium]